VEDWYLPVGHETQVAVADVPVKYLPVTQAVQAIRSNFLWPSEGLIVRIPLDTFATSKSVGTGSIVCQV